MKVKIFLLISLILSVCGSGEVASNQKFFDTLRSVAGKSGSPELQVAIEVLNAMRTETSHTIGQVQKQTGYSSMYISRNKDTGAIKIHNLERLVGSLLSEQEFSSLGQEYKDFLARAISQYQINENDEGMHKERFTTAFSQGQGRVSIMVFDLTPNSKPGVVNYLHFVSEMAFEIAADFVIVTNSDCNLFSCDRTDEIVYLKANLKPEDINALLNANLNFISAFSYGEQLTIANQNHRQLGNRDL